MSTPMKTMAAEDAQGPGLDAIRDALRALLVQMSEGKLQEDEVDPSANLFDFGYVDSLSGIAFIAEIETRYGVRIEDMELVESLSTLDAIAAHVHANA